MSDLTIVEIAKEMKQNATELEFKVTAKPSKHNTQRIHQLLHLLRYWAIRIEDCMLEVEE